MPNRTLVLSLLGMSLLFVAQNWNSFAMPFERDEGEYAYSAWLLREGSVPYRDSFLQKPPMIVYVYALGQLFDPDSVVPPRILASLFSILTFVLTGLIARELYGKRAGWLTAWVILPLSMLPLFLPNAANTEKFLLLPLVTCLYVVVRCGVCARWWQWMVAGVSAATAILFKPVAAVPLLILFCVWWGETMHSQGTHWTGLRNAGLAVGAILITVGIATAYFVFRHAFRELIECTITYNSYYAEAGKDRIRLFPLKLWILLKQCWPALIFLTVFLFRRSSRWILMSSLLLAVLAIASTDVNGHYYLMLVPFLAIMSASGLDSFLQWLLPKAQSERRRKLLAFGVPAGVIVLLLLPSLPRMMLQPKQLCSVVYGSNPFVESALVAEHVQALCRPNDSIFVAGSEPQILFYAKRKSVTRFDIVYPLTIPTPVAIEYQRELNSALEI